MCIQNSVRSDCSHGSSLIRYYVFAFFANYLLISRMDWPRSSTGRFHFRILVLKGLKRESQLLQTTS